MDSDYGHVIPYANLCHKKGFYARVFNFASIIIIIFNISIALFTINDQKRFT